MPTPFRIRELERQIDNAEDDYVEAHKLYNNLGVAHSQNHDYKKALKAHRQEKRLCRKLVERTYPPKTAYLLDLAIAYRRCGDVMLKLDKLLDSRNKVIDVREDVIRMANEQHRKGLNIVREDIQEEGVNVRKELQQACAAVSYSAVQLALETRDKAHFKSAAFCCVEAAVIAESLQEGDGIAQKEKEKMLLGAGLNMAIAVSGMGEREKGKRLLRAIAVKSKRIQDDFHLVRAVANLAEEAGLDGDWKQSELYCKEWVKLAKKHNDEEDQANALRKLGLIYREQGQLNDAKNAVETALFMAKTKHAQDEARQFLNEIDHEIEDRHKTRRLLDELEGRGSRLQREQRTMEEARVRLDAGLCAHKLGKRKDVVRLLTRYFTLVEHFGCDPVATSVEQGKHNEAVASMGEAMWKLKRYEEAVRWASKELALFTDDIPGQAQAWCNLGVYLDDYGKKENAIDALKQSIELAEKCGETGTLEQAKTNLELIFEEMKTRQASTVVIEARLTQKPATRHEDPEPTIDHVDIIDLESGSRVPRGPTARSNTVVEDGDRSIIMDSSQPMNVGQLAKKGPVSQLSHGISSRRSLRDKRGPRRRGATQTRLTQSRGNASGFVGMDGQSSAGVRNYIDLVAEYKAICAKRRHPPVQTRAMVITALRSLSSNLLARQACDEPSNHTTKLDVSALFLNNHDVSAVVETLACLDEDQFVALNMGLNPMITPAAYDCLNPRVYSSPTCLYAVRSLDLSCAGVSAATIIMLSDALSVDGALRNVSHLNLSKNGLGKQCHQTAKSLLRVFCRASNLEVIDLSLNLLPKQFLQELIQEVDNVVNAGEDDNLNESPVKMIDLHLNNRRAPSALLESEDVNSIVQCMRKLFQIMTNLDSIDVRACGASAMMRKSLRLLAHTLPGMSGSIVTVSPDIHDEHLDEPIITSGLD